LFIWEQNRSLSKILGHMDGIGQLVGPQAQGNDPSGKLMVGQHQQLG